MKTNPVTKLALVCLTSWVCIAGTVPTSPSVLVERDGTAAAKQSQALAVEVVSEFPNRTWLENLAVRPNGQILATTVTAPELWLLDPFAPSSTPVLVHSFDGHIGMMGIVEVEHDVFYVIAEGYDQPSNTVTPGLNAVYRVDMCEEPPKIGLVAKFPHAGLLNGIARLSANSSLLLVGDAGEGVVYSLDVGSGTTAVVMDDASMKPPKGRPVGLDGLKVQDHNLYFTNAPLGTFVRVPLNGDGTPAGAAEVLLTGWLIDDFAFGPDGAAYMTVWAADQIAKFHMGSSNATVVTGPSEDLNGPTACRFGRTWADHDMLYVTTNGGLGIADRSSTFGGTLSRIDIGRHHDHHGSHPYRFRLGRDIPARRLALGKT